MDTQETIRAARAIGYTDITEDYINKRIKKWVKFDANGSQMYSLVSSDYMQVRELFSMLPDNGSTSRYWWEVRRVDHLVNLRVYKK